MTGRRPPATVVLVAAGSGERLGADRPKALVPLAGRPLFAWSLEAARAAEHVDRVVIAAPPGRESEFEVGAALRREPEKGEAGSEASQGGGPEGAELTVVAGGASRSESVLLALEQVDTELVAVHDAARPFVEPALFEQVLARLDEEPELGGVVAASPVTDTIKRCVGEGRVIVETLDRSELWAAQTPQAFRTAVLRKALESAPSLAAATDDAMLVEGLGHRVEVLAAPPTNFKVTTSADLHRAESILADNVDSDAYRLSRPSPS